ncbi:MAG: hypothetical protein ACREPR_26860 [Brasilonema sp.]
MSSNVKLLNQTATTVVFGLYSAPNDHDVSKKVSPGASDHITLSHSDARSVAAWISSNILYPNNDEPFVTGAYFEDNQSYTVILKKDEITVSHQ